MTTLHLVTGLYSAVNSFSSRYVDPRDDHHVVVLFSEPADEAGLAERIRALPGVRSVSFLPHPPEYVEILADPERMTALCGGRTPQQLRMFLTHQHWLTGALASAFPEAGVSLFEEGMAGLYPDNLLPLTFLDRVVRVEFHHYLGAFAPLSALDRPELFEEIDAVAFTRTLERACGRHDAGLTPDTVVLVEQYFDRKGDAVSTDELVDVYRGTVETLLAKGYRVAYKPHPRHASAVYDAIATSLPQDAVGGLTLMTNRELPLEVLMATSRPAAVVAVNSTLLLTAPHLLGVPAFLVDVDFGLRMARSLAGERTGQLANYLALRDRVPTVGQLPAVDSGVEPWAVLERQVGAVPPMTDDPLLAAVRGVGGAATPALPEAFRALLSSAAPYVSFDVFDTLVVRPVSHPSDLVSVLDRELAPDLPPMARYSNARNAAVGTLRAAHRAAGVERAEYPIEAVAEQTARLLGGGPGDGGPDGHGPDGKALLAAETALEERHLAPRALGAALMLFAHRLGKRVGLVSDTFYSSDELLELVGPHLPVEPAFVFASADVDATKAEGGLFDVVLRGLGIGADELLHVGDNPVSDVERATARDIAALHVPSVSDAARRTRALGGLWADLREEKGLSLVKGVVAQRFFDNPFTTYPKGGVSLGTPYALGYGIAGPALLGWTLWVAHQVRDLGYDDVSFLSRDGYVPHGIYERLRETDPDLPPARYVLASRRAALQVFSGDPAHVATTQFVHGVNPVNTPRTLLTTRFGAGVVGLLEGALAQAGITDLDAPVGRQRSALSAVLAAHAEEVAAACAERSAGARRHYAERLAGAQRPVVVDLGYSGSSQRAIMTSVGRRVDGLYLIGMEHALEYAVITGARFEPWSQDRTFFRYGTVLEYLLSPVGLPECLGFDPVGRPVLAPTVAGDRHNAEIQRGVAEFVDDVFARFGERVPMLAMRPDSATLPLSRFIASPSAADARMLVGALQDDATGSGGTGLMDAWQPGRDALARA